MAGLLGPGGQPGAPEDTRNLIITMMLAIAIIFGFDLFVTGPNRERKMAAEKAQAQIAAQAPPAATTIVDRASALAQTARVKIDNAAVDGSINLTGARFDDLALKNYRQMPTKGSPEVTLLTPQSAKGAYDSYFGWENVANGDDLVGARTEWTAPAGASLTPNSPVVLTYAAPGGLVFTRTITIDDSYMFTIADAVRNDSAAHIDIRPFSVVRRRDLPADFLPNQIVHQGLTGALGPQHLLEERTYQTAQRHAKEKLENKRQIDSPMMTTEGPGGWLGISDHYWLAALIPAQTEVIKATYDATPSPGYTDLRADYVGTGRPLAPGASVTYTQHFFAGAKRVDVLQAYQASIDGKPVPKGTAEAVPSFDKAVDWGNFWFLTRPYFMVLDYFGKITGSFGLAILIMTVLVKIVLYPLLNQSFSAMSKMRKLQPKMKEIQERFAADKTRQQQEMMQLYQKEKVNPLAGCLPILIQIPIMYALYKVLTVTIELRHAPFLWIHDLSARDPLMLGNLFGLLNFNPATIPILGFFLGIGMWAIIYGVTMYASQAMSAQPTDATQAMIFKLMPIIVAFMFSSAAVGLVIYWTWSNILSIAQQYVIMRQNGIETEFDKWLAKLRGQNVGTGAA
jgi:YidC/Oxa1 family membrane protein insertase